jgi:hypothetical protein
MPWLAKKGRVYFYRSAWVDCRPRSIYVGAGAPAEMEAGAAGRRRLGREARRAWRERLDADERAAAGLFDMIEAVARAALEAAGYHRHKRGEWRRRRMSKAMTRARAAAPPVPRPTLTAHEADELFRRLRDGDEAALPELRRYLDREGKAYVPHIGDVCRYAEEAAIRGFAGGDLGLAEVVRRRLELLRRELAGADATPLERLLAERVAMCWLWTYRLEHQAAAMPPVDVAQGDYLQRRIDAAHRRLMSAAKALATVRRLGRPGPLVAVQAIVGVVGGPGATSDRG